MKKTLVWLVLLKTLFLAGYLIFGPFRLGPDEAQYWTWSQDLSLGYYSKPPGIAYQIALGTALFGNNEFGVRFVSLLIGALMPFLIYRLAKGFNLTDEEAFWAALIWAFSPLGFVGSILAITDVGLILFWTLAVLALVEKWPLWQLGLIIALGALFKWPIYVFWLFALSFVTWDRRLLGAMGLSLLGLIPALWWNFNHDFATFRHVGATLQGGSGAKAAGNFWEFIGAQALLISPIFFYLLLKSYKEKREELSFAYLMTFLPLAAGALLSMFMKVQGNWAIIAFPTAPLLAAHVGITRPKWLKAGLILSLALVGALLFFIPLKHNTGWDKLPEALSKAGYDPDRHFLFSDKYQNSSLLSFYSPGQKRAYFLNLKKDRLNQFSFWPGMKDQEMRQDGYFAAFEPITEDLSSYFTTLGEKEDYPLIKKKRVYLQKGEDYNGSVPESLERY